mgnify:CR=1 FL=1
MNTTIVLGRLTADPENIKGGARFNIAVDSGIDKDGKPLTTFLQITAFGKLGDFIMKYGNKGKRYLVTSHIVNNNYEKNGQKVYALALIADRVEFADGKDTTPSNTGYTPQTPQNLQPASNGWGYQIPNKPPPGQGG